MCDQVESKLPLFSSMRGSASVLSGELVGGLGPGGLDSCDMKGNCYLRLPVYP